MKDKLNISKIQFVITMIICLVFTVTGATFAYLTFLVSNNTTISGEAATVSINLDVEKIFPKSTSTNTGVIVPQLSISGSNYSPLSQALKGGCVDANGNIVCQVYKVFIENNGGTATQIIDGIISFYGDLALTTNANVEIPNLKWKLITSANATTPSNSELGTNEDLEANFNENVFADDIELSTNQNRTYYIIVWLNETEEEQSVDVGKTYYGKIEAKSSNGTGVTSLFTP